MIYGSVCSGIEAASVAWLPLGWQCAFLSEIDPFPRAVLAYHFKDAPLHGDFTIIQAGDYRPIELLVGGTPCQSFSIAGLRGGLDDARGNLAIEYLRLAHRLRPRWLVWENVPGVLSSNGGRDFGAILGGMVELGYGFAYRVLDAQFFGVPQRRRRVFVVGYLGDWRRAAAVLFERESLSGNSPPRRETGQGIVAPIAGCSNGGGANGPDRSADDADSLVASTGHLAHCLNGGGMKRLDYETETLVAHSLRGGGFDASEDGTGRGIPLVPMAFMPTRTFGRDGGIDEYWAEREVADAVHTSTGNGNKAPVIAFHARQDPDSGSVTHPLDTNARSIGVATPPSVRRLTPVEAERLQGFPDGHTLIPMSRRVRRNVDDDFAAYLTRQFAEQGRGAPTSDDLARLAADGPRYRAIGNSMAVPVVRWLGERIQHVEETA